MNPSMKLGLMLVLAFEISFTNSITANVGIMILGLLLILTARPRIRTMLQVIFLPLFFALALVWSLSLRGTASPHFLWLIFTRMYAYVFLGWGVTLTTPIVPLIQSLEQNAHVSSKFAYGIMSGINLIPRIIQATKTIRVAAQTRGITLHFWSPTLYFKAILVAISWSENLAQAITSHGFVEDHPRTHALPIYVKTIDWIVAVIIIVVLQGLLFFP